MKREPTQWTDADVQKRMIELINIFMIEKWKARGYFTVLYLNLGYISKEVDERRASSQISVIDTANYNCSTCTDTVMYITYVYFNFVTPRIRTA